MLYFYLIMRFVAGLCADSLGGGYRLTVLLRPLIIIMKIVHTVHIQTERQTNRQTENEYKKCTINKI